MQTSSQALFKKPEYNSLAQTIFNRAEHICNILNAGGTMKAQPTSAHARQVILTASPEQLESIDRNLRFLEATLGLPVENVSSDQDMTREVLQSLRMKISNNFWNTIQADEVIEIYRPDGFQLFRSFNIFKTTGYSLLDLSFYTWKELWKRSSSSSGQIEQAISLIISGQTEIFSFNHQEDILKEVLNSTLTEPFYPRVLKVKLGHMVACRDISTNAITGFAVTTLTEVLSVGKASENLHFI